MAVHLSMGRIPSILLLALLGPAVAAGTAYYLSRLELEPAPAPASQITATVPLATPLAEVALAPEAEDETPLEADAENEVALAPEAEDETPLEANAEDEVALKPEFEAVIVVAIEPEAVPARPAAIAGQSEPGPTVAPVAAPVAPLAAAPAASQRRVTVARLVVEPQGSSAPRDPAISNSRPKNMAPIPKRAPRAATADTKAAPQNAATLFQSGTAIRVQKDASVLITARNIPDNDRLLEAYSAERPNSGRVETRLGEATALPGLLGIAAQAQRTQSGGPGDPAYSLADAMRDAIWRKNTAARLKSLTTAQNACAEGVGGLAKTAPSIGLAARC
jgi:hypothetical protein